MKYLALALSIGLTACIELPPVIVLSGPVATSTPVVNTPVAVPTAIPAAVQPRQLTNGRAVVTIDLRSFVARPGLDTYAAATLLWEPEPGWPKKPSTPALELMIAGVGPELCATPAGRCAGNSLGLVARWSANLSAYEDDKPDPCGEGVNKSQRLAIGGSRVFDVEVAWSPGVVRVSSPVESWTAQVGTKGPGFGLWVPDVPEPARGVGWEHNPWLLGLHGGRATLKAWGPRGPDQPPLGACP